MSVKVDKALSNSSSQASRVMSVTALSPTAGGIMNPDQGAMSPLAPLAASPQGSVEEGGLENAGRLVDQHMKEDLSFRELSGQLMIPSHSEHSLETCIFFTAIHST